jgi:hypothetical protein
MRSAGWAQPARLAVFARAALAERAQAGTGTQPPHLVADADDQRARVVGDVVMGDLHQAAGAIDGEVARHDPRLVARADEGGVERELRVLERLAHLLLELLGAAGLVVDELEHGAVLALAAVDAIDVAVQLQAVELLGRTTRFALAALPAPAVAFAVVQPRDVARHEAREAGVVRQERGGVDAHRGAHGLADLAQPRLVRVGGARLAALAMKGVEHLVQPRAVVALLDLVVELVRLGQMQHALGEEAVRARTQGLECAG